MKLKRRDFLKSIVPALIGGKQVVEDLLRGSGDEAEPEEVVRVDTPTCVTATCYPAYPPIPFSWTIPPLGVIYYDGLPLDEADVEHIAEEWAKATTERSAQ